MISISNLINLQIMMFIIMAVGVVVRKLEIITPVSRKNITNLFINIILPCNIISSFIIDMDTKILISSGKVLIIAFGVQIACILLSKVLYLNVPIYKKKILQYATICSNAGFMGNAITQGIYGNEGLLYTSIYLIPVRIFMWSSGLSCFTSTNRKNVIKNLLKHPCIIAVEIGFILLISQIKLPLAIDSSIRNLGNCTTAVSMLIIGTILAEVDFKIVVSKLNFYYSFIRLIFIPGLLLVIGYLFNVNSLLLGITVILAGMPAGSTTALLATQYGADEKCASGCIFLSTFLSMFTIPIFCIVLQKLI